MGGRPNPFAAARPANRTQQEQGNSPGSGRHMSPNAIMNVRPTLHYVGTCACRIYLWQPPLLLVDGDAHLEKTDEREPALLTSSLVCPLRKAIYGLNKPR
jgi:hypothetical protein